MISLSQDLDLGLDTSRMFGTQDAERQRATSNEILDRFFNPSSSQGWELQLVADEVGMGKTFVALSVAYSLLESMRRGNAVGDLKGCIHRVLIIAPHQTLADKWRREVKEFVTRCVVPEERDSAGAWFTAVLADRVDQVAHELARQDGAALVITHMGVLSGQRKLLHYDLKRRVLLGALFRFWGNRFGHDARANLLKGAPGGWPSARELTNLGEDPEAWKPTGFKDEEELMHALRRLEQQHRLAAGEGKTTELDDLLAKCREIAEPYVRSRSELFVDIERALNGLYRKVCFASATSALPLVMVDEAHHWRNGPKHNSNGYGTFKQQLAPLIRRALLLTATPFQLRPEEVLELVKVGEDLAASGDSGETERRRLRLKLHREKVIAPVLRKAAHQSRCFAQAWARLSETNSAALDECWQGPTMVALRAQLKEMAAESGDLDAARVNTVIEPAMEVAPLDLRDLLREGLRLYACNEDLSYELGSLVIRHRRRTDHRLCAVGQEYGAENSVLSLRTDRHLLHAAPGLEVQGEGELAHYLLMRCVSEMKGGRGRTSLGSALTGCYSTLLKSSEGRQLQTELPGGSVGRRYFDLLERMVQPDDDAKHPKVSAVVEAVLTAWRAGHKSLVFCFRTNTAKQLESIIDAAIEAELQLKLHGALRDEDALQRLRARFWRRDDDLVLLGLDRVLWSLRWAALWQQQPLALPELTVDDLTLRDEDLAGVARLALRAGVNLRSERVDRVFLHRVTEHLLALRLLRERPPSGRLIKEVLKKLADEAWVRFPYGADPQATENLIPDVEGESETAASSADEATGIHAHYELDRAVIEVELQDLNAYLVERRGRATQQDQISIFDSYARAPSFWLGVDIEMALREPNTRSGQALAAHHAHLLNTIRDKQDLRWVERLKLLDALRRTVFTRSVMLRLMPERGDVDAQGWAESLVGMYYKQLPGQHETFAERLTVYAEDFQSAGGSAWKGEGARAALYEASRLRWARETDGKARSGNVARIAGDTEHARRERVFAAFNSPLPPDVLICTSVGQEGIDLHRHCRNVIHYDLAWNPAVIEQRTGRVDRIGSKAFRDRRLVSTEAQPFLNVGVPFLAGTYDERMYEELRIRAQTFEVLTGGEVSADNGEERDAEEGAEHGLHYALLPVAMVNDLRVRLHVWQGRETVS
jgi:helicase-like protein/type III restriction/modification enzyme restriction subunit